MKRLLLLLTTLSLFTAARAFSFSATAPTGQTLYFTVTSATEVKVVPPAAVDWDGYAAPVGRLQIPATVTDNGVTYTVTAIDRMAFAKCYGLTAVTIPGSVVSIGMRAFVEDTMLTRAVLAEGVERIDMMAFLACSALDTIELPTTLTRIAVSAFEGTAFYSNADNWNDYMLVLGQWALKVGNLVAGGVTVPEGIVGLANSAFLYCRYMDRVDLPSTLRYVGEGTFNSCEVLDTVQVRAEVPPDITDDSFLGIPVPATLVVPCGRVAAYEAAEYWNAFDVVEDSCHTGIDRVEPKRPCVVVLHDGIEVRGAEGSELTLCDIMGRRLCTVRRAAASQRLPLPLPTVGVYILRIDGSAMKIMKTGYCR